MPAGSRVDRLSECVTRSCARGNVPGTHVRLVPSTEVHTVDESLVVDSQSHHDDSVAIKAGAVAMGVGIRADRGYTVRFADSDGVRKAPIM